MPQAIPAMTGKRELSRITINLSAHHEFEVFDTETSLTVGDP